MKLIQLRLSNFRCFGPTPVKIDLTDTTYILGPNGSGKTAVLQALARLFSLNPSQRKVTASDFHVPVDEHPSDAPATRSLWLEVDFEFPELSEDDILPAVASNFSHLLMEDDETMRVRFRLHATIDEDGDIEETFTNVTTVDEKGFPDVEARVSKQDRNAVQVHYLPAKRDPADHISYSTNALLGRALRSANWSSEREVVSDLTEKITEALVENAAIKGIGEEIAQRWSNLHKGNFFTNPSITFANSEVEKLLRHLSLSFTPGHEAPLVDFSRLSDGQQSLLYISLVLAMHNIGAQVLAGKTEAFDIDKLRPPIFTLIAIEEPENSLSPQYLGRVTKILGDFASGRDAQAVVATHAPSLLRRVDPETIRYLRLDQNRCACVTKIEMPSHDDEANKYVREGIQAFPEVYFARLVILGEGDSEEVVIPRMLAATGLLADDASITIAPLGGRHVNHFWRLLSVLGIPFVTLLDLDLARYQGGWGRIKYAATQLLKHQKTPVGFDKQDVQNIPKWDDEDGLMIDDYGWIKKLENNGVFFSSPLDLDLMMLEAFGEVYELEDSERETPDTKTIVAVLGKSHDTLENQYTEDQQELLSAYHQRFKLGSKPSQHLHAMSQLQDEELGADLPLVLSRMFDLVKEKLEELPE